MKFEKLTDTVLKVLCGLLLLISLVLTFTISDYYIFNRFDKYGILAVCQWVKKAGLLLIPLAVFMKKRSCSDIAKYILPVFVIVSSFVYGDFFDISPFTSATTSDELIYASINSFIPKSLNIALFYISNILYIIICAGLFIKDGYEVKAKSFIRLAPAIIACMPLNFFENFFDINNIPKESFLRFANFTIWHFLAILCLGGFTVACYYFLRHKDRKRQEDFLIAGAIVMLIQYHSKDSMIIGDGYNVYHTVFACVPLFICNIGVYTASLSVIFKKKVLYSLAFFIHAGGALSVFVYFGKDDMSNYGIFCSYSILYFMLTHCLLFALSVIPSALGHYRFRPKDCIIPLVYYFIILVIAAITSAVVSSASLTFSYGGNTLSTPLMPNYAFTQLNPLPFEIESWQPKITVWKYELNVWYILGLYAFYVGIFLIFNAMYYAFLFTRKKILSRKTAVPAIQAEAVFTEDEKDD